jgi:ATP-dependent Lon protease
MTGDGQMQDIKKIIKRQVLPLLPLRGLTIFPFTTIYFDVGRTKSIKALEEAMTNNQLIFLVTQKDARNESPNVDDLYSVGTISKVKQLLKLPGDTIRVLVEGLTRAQILELEQKDPYFIAEIVEKNFVIQNEKSIDLEALRRQAISTFEDYAKISAKITPEIVMAIGAVQDTSQLADSIAGHMHIKIEAKQELLDEFNPISRLEKVLEVLCSEIEIIDVERNINARVRKQIDKTQKEYYLREQIKAIQTELGDKDGIAAEVEEYKVKLLNANLPEEAEKKVLKELERLIKMPQGVAEATVIRNYLDWIFDLPWNKTTIENLDILNAEAVLNEDHYGLDKVKERIVEFLSVRIMKNDLKGPILCLVGPPGVGKTSIAKSIARALNRKYVRMSLGGVRDEAEIRGHRKTYVGAMPGRIITALKQAGTKNPLILLDEIDKMTSDFRGDPSAALLEVLDSEQNFSFRDHFIELPFDLSEVLILTTANSLETIPRPLLDRMEVINISSYTEEEKTNIAIKHLLPKQIIAHGMKKSSLRIGENVVRDIINYYTKEAGVRSLERQVGTICRKCVRLLLTNGKKSITITSTNLGQFLGNRKYRYDKAKEKNEIGMATGLAWTPVGGDTLTIEVNIMNGTGKLELTGQLGDVMKESAKAAMSYIRSIADKYDINDEFYKDKDIHIHVPEGAIPKDGPSAGITLATAMLSAITGIPVRRNVAMTGEITLRGRVLPIGGLKEKVIAANRAGIDTVIIPIDNLKDTDEIPDNVKKNIKFVLAAQMETVLETAFTSVSQ